MSENINTTSENSLIAKNEAVLPLFLRPIKGADLVRIGRDNDGGYLVDKRSIISSEFLLGFGIYDDWSFEKDFIKYVDVPVVAFDASVGQKIFFKEAASGPFSWQSQVCLLVSCLGRLSPVFQRP